MTQFAPSNRRQFLSNASRFGALSALATAVPFRAFATSVVDDPRLSTAPFVDEGFAAVHKIGDGIYATISNTSKGFTTLCNGGFLFGKDAGLLLEGFGTAAGARFQMEVFRKATQVPAAGALDTHYHFDHTMGNAFYGANGIQLWAHSAVSKRIMESYVSLQGADRAAALAPAEKLVQVAKTDVARQHAKGTLAATTTVFDLANKTSLAFPNRPLDPAQLPLSIDLGHFPIRIEHYPGHSGTDLIVRAPEQNVVFTGDLVFNQAYPACFDEKCTMSGWRETLKTFASWDKDTIFVPGHGPVCGQAGIQSLRSLFDDLADQAAKMHKAGVPLSDAVDQYVVPEKFKNFAIFAWGFCISGAISKLYAEMGAS